MFNKLILTKVIFSTVFLGFVTVIGGTSISYADDKKPKEPTIYCLLPDKSTVQTTATQCKASGGRVK